jgi:hypothetical protein
LHTVQLYPLHKAHLQALVGCDRQVHDDHLSGDLQLVNEPRRVAMGKRFWQRLIGEQQRSGFR